MIEDEEFDSLDGEAPQLVPAGDKRYAGVRALWMKVIVRAVFDWVTYRDHSKLEKRKHAESAHSWLFDKSLLFNSFDNVCKYLDIDPERIRSRAKMMTKEDVAKIEHMERDYEDDTEDPPPPQEGVLRVRRVSYSRFAERERVSDGAF